MEKKNILESVLLGSGTGVLQGYFRLPPYIFLKTFDSYLWNKENSEGTDPKNTAEREMSIQNLEQIKREMGEDFSALEAYEKHQVINLSKKDGTFLGTYMVADIDQTDPDEKFDYFTLMIDTPDSPSLNVCIDIKLSTFDSNFGSCLIYINEEGEELLKFD